MVLRVFLGIQNNTKGVVHEVYVRDVIVMDLHLTVIIIITCIDVVQKKVVRKVNIREDIRMTMEIRHDIKVHDINKVVDNNKETKDNRKREMVTVFVFMYDDVIAILDDVDVTAVTKRTKKGKRLEGKKERKRKKEHSKVRSKENIRGLINFITRRKEGKAKKVVVGILV